VWCDIVVMFPGDSRQSACEHGEIKQKLMCLLFLKEVKLRLLN